MRVLQIVLNGINIKPFSRHIASAIFAVFLNATSYASGTSDDPWPPEFNAIPHEIVGEWYSYDYRVWTTTYEQAVENVMQSFKAQMGPSEKLWGTVTYPPTPWGFGHYIYAFPGRMYGAPTSPCVYPKWNTPVGVCAENAISSDIYIYACIGVNPPPVCQPPYFTHGGIVTKFIYFNSVVETKQYNIKLSTVDGTSESAIVLKSVEPGKSVGIVARVYDQNNQLVPNVGVELKVDVVPTSGGHNHDDTNRHNNYAGTLAPVISINGTVVNDGGKTLAGNTGSSGLSFYFNSPVYPNNSAGDHTFKVTCTDGKTCILQGPSQVLVGINDLLAIPESSLGLWKLSGGSNPADPNDPNNQHPNNHYLTREAAQQLVELAANYHAQFPNDPPLNLNDASLVRGGLFDIYGWVDADGVAHSRADEPWWTTPHKEHRKGVVIDIQANGTDTAIPRRNFKVFQQLIQGLRMSYIFEGSHYHVRLLGISQ